jgi:hypothetical protein
VRGVAIKNHFCKKDLSVTCSLPISVRKPEGKRPLGRQRHRWEDNIRMDLQAMVGRHGLDSSGSGQGPVAGSCEHSNEPSGSIKG